MLLSQIQNDLKWEQLPSIPDDEGFAGMFAGTSNGQLFCMGGSNFPGKKPWEGGKKNWNDEIFMFDGKTWTILKEKLPVAMGYGVSVSYKEQIIIVGGDSESGYSKLVFSHVWKDGKMQVKNFPSLPFPLAYMSGGVIGDLLIITGGRTSTESLATRKCLSLDLNNLRMGWIENTPLPGSERILSTSAIYGGKYYLFGGETSALDKSGKSKRVILGDVYCFTPSLSFGQYSGTWQKLADMPIGLSALPSPVPVIPNKGLIFWGGLDAITALFPDPANHPGFGKQALNYDPETDSWTYLKLLKGLDSPIVAPVVKWNNGWIYINGEIRPGVRTNTVYSFF